MTLCPHLIVFNRLHCHVGNVVSRQFGAVSNNADFRFDAQNRADKSVKRQIVVNEAVEMPLIDIAEPVGIIFKERRTPVGGKNRAPVDTPLVENEIHFKVGDGGFLATSRFVGGDGQCLTP